MAKVNKVVQVAYGHRKLPRSMVFNYSDVTEIYEVRMSGEIEFLRIYQPKGQSVVMDDASHQTVQPGQWVAAVMTMVGKTIRHDGVLCIDSSAKAAYQHALDYIW